MTADYGAPRGGNQTQAVFTGFMMVVALGLFVAMTLSSVRQGSLVTLQTMFTGGTFLSAIALAAAVWKRPNVIYGLSVALMLIGLAAIVMLTIYPVPSIDPVLRRDGLWTHGPAPIAASWARVAMATVILGTGLALPFTQGRRQFGALSALTVLRISLWVGAFYQVAFIALDGRFDRLFDDAAAVIQGTLILAMIGSWALLLRGDRGWLGTLTEADRTVSMARFILPVALVPVLGAYLAGLGANAGLFDQSVAALLNIETSSVTLLLVGSAALRSLWRERRSRESLAKALERSPVIVHSEDGYIEYWPQGCEALYGFTAEEAIGRRLPDLLKVKYAIPAEEIESTLRRTGEWSGEVRHTTRSGKRLWIASNIVIDAGTGDSGNKIVETLTDITDIKTSNAALRDTADSLKQAVSTYELGIVDYDLRTGRSQFSPELEHILGLETGGLGGDQAAWVAHILPEDVVRTTESSLDDIRHKRSRRDLTIKIRRVDGEIRDLQGMLRYRYSPTGDAQRVVGIYMDVTEMLRDRAEVAARGARLLEIQSELTHTSRLSAMGEMAAALAHELNQPLTAVGNSVGAIGMILADAAKPVDEKKRQQVLRAARHAETQAVRAGEIVRRLREFISRGEADTQVENLEVLIADAVALALPNPAAAGVEVRRCVAPGAVTVLADRIQVQQVMVNLVRNAVEAMKGQQRAQVLTISARVVDGMALVQVVDTGAGVTPEGEERLFAPFMSTKRDGMGVGLSICRRIIEAHGGRMWFEPAKGGGAEFNFTLPIIPIEASHDRL